MCGNQLFGGILCWWTSHDGERSKSNEDLCDCRSSQLQDVAVKRATSQILKAFARIAGLCAVSAVTAFGVDGPLPQAFQIFPDTSQREAPSITPYLRYQTEIAWQQDDARRRAWGEIRTEEDLKRVQDKIEENLLGMLGGLPVEKTPLRARITGTIAMEGFRIEKLIYESLPGV